MRNKTTCFWRIYLAIFSSDIFVKFDFIAFKFDRIISGNLLQVLDKIILSFPPIAYCNTFSAIPFISTIFGVITTPDHIAPCVIYAAAFFSLCIATSISKATSTEH